MKEAIKIYTDGAARGNPGPAGWAAVILLSQNSGEPRVLQEIGGRSDHATNNIMELTAPIEALKYVKKHLPRLGKAGKIHAPLEIFSDSKYVITGINEWIHNWLKNNWRTANKKPVLNQELWQELHALNQEFKPMWHYVKGHNGDKWNDRADEIATSFADDDPVKLKKSK